MWFFNNYESAMASIPLGVMYPQYLPKEEAVLFSALLTKAGSLIRESNIQASNRYLLYPI